MDAVDLTLSDEEDDDIVVIKSKIIEQCKSNKPRSSQIDKDVYSFFYGTEDKTQEFLAIQHPAARKVVKYEYKIFCPICHLNFTNINFVHHIIDHYNMDLHTLDSLLIPRISNNIVKEEWCAVKCEICDIKFTSLITLGQHLQKKHVYKDMPYVCFVCNFYRTSFLSELKQHFYDYHTATQYLVCPLCIEIFELSARSPDIADVLDARLFIAHLDRHMNKRQFSCDKCSLKYFSKNDLIYHRTVYHDGRSVPEKEEEIGADKFECKLIKKSLNVSSQPIDISKLSLNLYRLPMTCGECRDQVTNNIVGHYQSYHLCPLCGFSSYCAASYRRHTKTMHNALSLATDSNAHTHSNASMTVDVCRDNDGVLLCRCGYRSIHGDRVARHLTTCNYRHCYVTPRLDLHSSLTNGSAFSSDNDILAILNLQPLAK